jgi:hypothetical protein
MNLSYLGFLYNLYYILFLIYHAYLYYTQDHQPT